MHLRDPVGLDDDVVVRENDDLAARLGDRPVARMVQPLACFPHIPRWAFRPGEGAHDLLGVVGARVVDHEDLELVPRKVLAAHALQGLPEQPTAIVRANGDRDTQGGN